EILSRIHKAGFSIVAIKSMRLTKEEAGGFYAVHKARPFFGELTDFMSSGKIIAMVLEAEGAISKWRDAMGATDPKKAAPGTMRRRTFLHHAARGVAAAFLASHALAKRLLALPVLTRKFAASDPVTLGRTGIQTSLLAMGTGTVGSGHHSHQTALGVDGLSKLLLNGYDNVLRFFDAADSYGSHPHVAEALKHVPRDKVTILTKTWARDPATARADLDRFRKELGTDTIDICLMHCLTEGDWTERYKGVMDVLSEAKQKGIIRAHGCSCHSIDALRAATK